MHVDLVGNSPAPPAGKLIAIHRPVFFTFLTDYAADQQRRNAKWETPRLR